MNLSRPSVRPHTGVVLGCGSNKLCCRGAGFCLILDDPAKISRYSKINYRYGMPRVSMASSPGGRTLCAARSSKTMTGRIAQITEILTEGLFRRRLSTHSRAIWKADFSASVACTKRSWGRPLIETICSFPSSFQQTLARGSQKQSPASRRTSIKIRCSL